MDSSNNVYIADNTYRIRKVTSSGIISIYAGTGSYSGGIMGDGGPATSATISAGAWSLFVDTSNNLYIDDNSLSTIRKINIATGIITTVAGTGGFGNTPFQHTLSTHPYTIPLPV